ncbi:MAG: hypothetical protein HQK59_01730 [Deltaproteobacteria bacterium]|nr:hypothetical protein [Deltaproteobacteria bacterium]
MNISANRLGLGLVCLARGIVLGHVIRCLVLVVLGRFGSVWVGATCVVLAGVISPVQRPFVRATFTPDQRTLAIRLGLIIGGGSLVSLTLICISILGCVAGELAGRRKQRACRIPQVDVLCRWRDIWGNFKNDLQYWSPF